MDKIKHNFIKANGINIHVAEMGEGLPVLFLHGFPELWYSWRHQMLYLSSLGYRALAPDLRGFGDTDVPPSATSYTIFHLTGDLMGLLDAMGLDKVFLVAHDWGAYIAWFFCLFRPDRIKALVSLSVFEPRDPSRKPIEAFRQIFGEDYYRWRFQDPEIEEEFASVDTSTLMKSFFSYRDPSAPQMPKGFTSLISSPALPSWLTEEDVTYYASKFNKTGFTGGLNYYRAMDLDWELTAAWAGSKSQVPAKYLVGGLDITYHVPGVKEYVHNGKFKKSFHYLEEVVVMEGVAHFINQEKSEEISSHIYDFIKKF